jgi:hypothetical protein
MLALPLQRMLQGLPCGEQSQRSDINFFIYKLACIIGAESDLAIGFEKNNII